MQIYFEDFKNPRFDRGFLIICHIKYMGLQSESIHNYLRYFCSSNRVIRTEFKFSVNNLSREETENLGSLYIFREIGRYIDIFKGNLSIRGIPSEDSYNNLRSFRTRYGVIWTEVCTLI